MPANVPRKYCSACRQWIPGWQELLFSLYKHTHTPLQKKRRVLWRLKKNVHALNGANVLSRLLHKRYDAAKRCSSASGSPKPVLERVRLHSNLCAGCLLQMGNLIKSCTASSHCLALQLPKASLARGCKGTRGRVRWVLSLIQPGSSIVRCLLPWRCPLMGSPPPKDVCQVGDSPSLLQLQGRLVPVPRLPSAPRLLLS